MNCVEFRRQLGVDPHSSGAAFAQHLGECARCASATDRALEFDRALRRALAVEPPVQIADSILLAQATAQRRRRSTLRRAAVLSLAASFALAIGIFGTRVEATPLSAQAVAHVEREASMLNSDTAVAAGEIGAAFAQRGVKLRQIPEGVSFVACCPLGSHKTVHLLMPDGDDPITVIYVIDQRSATRENFVRDGWSGRILPVGSGTLILLAHHPLAFDRVEATWQAAIAS